MIDNDLIQYLVKEANRLGRKGMKIIGWIPPQLATQDYRGAWVYDPNSKAKSAADGEED